MSLPLEDSPSFRFGRFELDVARMELRREGAVVAIAPKPLELLILLVRNRDRVVSRPEALAAVWPDVSVSPATLASTLRDLRRALGDDAEAPAFVETARGLGFRLLAPVEVRQPRQAGAGNEGEAPFVGRKALLERLEDALAAAARGRGGILLLEGEPGIGKTRALEALASAARTTGAIVCQARFPEGGAGPAYRPWAQLLTALVESRPADRLEEEMDGLLPALARLVPGLAAAREGADVLDAESEDEGTTLRLFDAVTHFLRRVSRAAPLALVLDDLQGADRSSLRLLEHLADEIREARILILGAYRSCELDDEHPLPATLAELARMPGYARVRLEGVDLEATRALVVAATGRDPGEERLAEIHARTDGNPFYVHELARYLAEADPDARSRSVPPGLRELLRGRLQRLPLRCRNTLELASVVGREFDLELLRRSSGLDVSDLMDALESGRRAGLVDMGWGSSRRFRHVLVQEAIYAGLPEARRRLLHRVVGEACRGLLSAGRSDRLPAAARHLCQVAEEVGLPAVEIATAAAEFAESQLAFAEAERLYGLALGALDRIDTGDRERRCRLLLALARARLRSGELGRAVDTARSAAALARAVSRPDLLARAALLFGDYVLVDSSEPRALLEEVIGTLGPEHEALRGRSLAALSVALWYDGQAERRLALAKEAVAIARAAESPPDVVAALMAEHHALLGPGRLRERLRVADQALREAQRADSDVQRCVVLSWRSVDLLESGDRIAAERDIARLEEIARSSKQPRYLDHAPRWRATFATIEGRFDAAEQLIAESARLRERAELPTTESYAGAQTGALMRERGQLVELDTGLLQADWYEALRMRIPAARTVAALVELEVGRPGTARRLIEEFAAQDFATLADDPDALLTVSWLAEICSQLGAREPAAALYERFAAYRDQVACLNSIVCRGSFARYLGVLAAAAGRPVEAAECFEASLAANRALHAALFEAWTQWEYAGLLNAQGQRERARALALEARATAVERGLHRLRDVIDADSCLALGAA